MDKREFLDISLKKCDQAKTLIRLQKSVSVGNREVLINSTHLLLY